MEILDDQLVVIGQGEVEAALACNLERLLDGEAIAYLDEVERIYDIQPTAQPESRFAAAHRALDDALPGPGPIAERLARARRLAREAVEERIEQELEQPMVTVDSGRLGKAEGRILLPDGTLAAESHMSLADVPRELLDSADPRLLNWKVD